ncbi:MAG: putative ABC transporter permease [Coriobacteriales bacterium]|jgi:uncharacterized membrane protein|nr:putative ABC transporter permease [Coriobacteriales bacterium]
MAKKTRGTLEALPRAVRRPNARPWQRYYYYFLFAAFMGFVYENLLDNLWYHHPWQWQGPLHGPWLVIYGAGGLLLLVLLEKLVKKKASIGKVNIMPVLIILLIFAIVCTVEYAGHWLLDTFFDFRPWDYTNKPFNLNGRVCLEDSLRFVALGVLELYVFLPLVDGLLCRVSKRQNLVIFIVLVAAFVIDIVYSVLVMLR